MLQPKTSSSESNEIIVGQVGDILSNLALEIINQKRQFSNLYWWLLFARIMQQLLNTVPQTISMKIKLGKATGEIVRGQECSKAVDQIPHFMSFSVLRLLLAAASTKEDAQIFRYYTTPHSISFKSIKITYESWCYIFV